ncbi:MAG: hypothetical protein JSS44_08645 [Proteobacteria bacterium]|nr:hypothetical protein [Pseudomonadota bacterium]
MNPELDDGRCAALQRETDHVDVPQIDPARRSLTFNGSIVPANPPHR